MTDKYAGHTSGAWRIDRDQRTGYEWNNIIMAESVTAICFMSHKDEGNEECEANARLIADAPKLLEENKRLREALKDTTQTLDMVMEECHETVWETVGGQVAGAIYEQIDEAEKALKESEDGL